jgi:hypothetical protein
LVWCNHCRFWLRITLCLRSQEGGLDARRLL